MPMDEVERWTDILGYEGYYQVSHFGRVRSVTRTVPAPQARYKRPRKVTLLGRVLKNYCDGTDRYMVILRKNGRGKHYSVHRLVASHFLPNPFKLPVVNHINHNHHDNSVYNLEWCTYKHNTQHAIAAGRMNHIYKTTK